MKMVKQLVALLFLCSCQGSFLHAITKRLPPRVGDDAVFPTVSSVRTNPPVVGPGSTLVINFTPSEPLSTLPIITLALPAAPYPAQATLLADGSYEASFGPFLSGADGAWPAVVDLVDAAANLAPAQPLGSIIFDFRAPQIVSLAAAPAVVGVGKTATLSLVATEPLSAPPQITVSCGGTEYPATVSSGTETLFFQAWPAPSAAITTTCSCSVAMTDVAKNSVTYDVADCLALDTVVPDAGAFDASALMHFRAPVGSATVAPGHFLVASTLDASADPSTSTIPASVFADDVVEVRAYADAAGTQLLGVSKRENGHFPAISLTLVDAPTIFVVGVDAAGNQSALVPVKHGRWLASTRGKVAGKQAPNPHQLFSATRLSGRIPPVSPEHGDLALSPLSVSVGASFVRLGGPSAPLPSLGHAAALDRWRNRIVMIGGGNDTWEWTGARWIHPLLDDPEGDGDPDPTSNGSAMAFDEITGEMVLHDGEKTWLYNGRSWRVVATLHRGFASMTYDAARAMVVIFSGVHPACLVAGQGPGCSNILGWDGDSWNVLDAADPGPVPNPRAYSRMAYDRDRGVVVLIGGTRPGPLPSCDGSPSQLCESIWEWDGAWHRRCDGVPGSDTCSAFPLGFSGGAAAYDETQHAVVFATGATAGVYVDTMGLWNGQDWTLLGPTGPTGAWPRQRTFAAAATAPDGRFWLHGGGTYPATCDGGTSTCATIWTLEQRRWLRPQQMDFMPPARQDAEIASAPSGATYMLGGNGASGPTGDPLPWFFDGTGWLAIAPSGDPSSGNQSPLARIDHAIAFDAGRNTLVIFGGTSAAGGGCNEGVLCDYWWELGEDKTWRRRCDGAPAGDTCTGSLPEGRVGARMAYAAWASQPHAVVMVGGFSPFTCDGDATGNCRGVYSWNGTGFARGPDLPAQGLENGAFAFDPIGDRLVYFGGTQRNAGTYDETFVFNGTSWTQIATSPACRPPARADGTMFFSPGIARIVLIRGNANLISVPTDDGWMLVGDCWQPLAFTDPEGDRSVVNMGRSGHGASVFFGDNPANAATWRFDDGAGARSAAIFRVDFHTLDALPAATVTRLTTSVSGSGFDLMVWNGGSYVPAPTSITDGSVLARLFADGQPALDLAARSQATGYGANVQLTGIEAQVDYVLP